jgi:hypothetical protein
MKRTAQVFFYGVTWREDEEGATGKLAVAREEEANQSGKTLGKAEPLTSPTSARELRHYLTPYWPLIGSDHGRQRK